MTLTEITQPGVYDLADDVYLADPVPEWSLSNSGARTILDHTPARYLWERQNGRPDTPDFDLGKAAHKVVLGAGPELVTVEGDGKAGPEVWNTNTVKEKVAQVREAGGVPLKPSQYEQVQAMAAALREHPTAAKLLAPGSGEPERSLFWRDRVGIWRRARLDWLPNTVTRYGRMVVPDYKTAESANPDDFRRAAASYGYHQQAPWYSDGIKALRLAEDVSFVFVVQEKKPPYLVSIVELHPDAIAIGEIRNRQAIDTFAECLRTGRWPGYGDDVHLVRLPVWVERQYEQEIYQ